MTVGHINCFKGRVLPDSTLTIDGAEWPIPFRCPDGSSQVGDRVRAAALTAGYRVDGAFLDAISDIDDFGGYDIELMRLSLNGSRSS